jgi:hypothetical protein
VIDAGNWLGHIEYWNYLGILGDSKYGKTMGKTKKLRWMIDAMVEEKQ